MRKLSLIFALMMVAAGCAAMGGNAQNDLGMNGGDDGGAAHDLAPPADLVDTTALPAPTSKHVGSTGVTIGLTTHDDKVLYLLSPTAGSPATGELRLASADGSVDKSIATGVALGNYGFAADGKAIVWLTDDGSGKATASLHCLDLTNAAATAKTAIASGVYGPLVPYGGTSAYTVFAPSGHFLLVGVVVPNVAVSLDLHVVDLRSGTDVYQRGNGAFDYLEIVLPDDTMIFQDTVGGQGTAGAPPVQTLFWVPLGTAAGTPAATINTRTTVVETSADNKLLYFQRSSGDLYKWDLASKSGSGTKLASGVVKFVLGGAEKGPIAYLGSDRSVHVIDSDGNKLLDVAAAPASAADLFGPIFLAADAADVYYFQAFDTQDRRGTLMRVAVQGGATPGKVGDKISSADVFIMDSALVLLQNVDDLGQFGDVVKANRDGSNMTPLGMKANVGGLRAVNPGPGSWSALHLSGAAADPMATNVPIDGSLTVYGSLAFADGAGNGESSLDAKVHAGAFAFADDGRTAAFVSGAAWNATANNYVGALGLIAVRAPSMKVDAMLSGVSELGPITGRGLFASAPTATPAGVYYVKY